MTCSLLKIPALSSETLENAHICEARKLVAVTTADLKLRIYSFPEWTGEPLFIREYKNHAGAILTAAFAPLKYHGYFVTAGYDKSVYLYNLDDGKLTDAAFSYPEENPQVGYSTCVAFVPIDKTRLIFALGTSTGHVQVFDSHCNFEPKTHALFNTPVKSISGSASGELAVAATGSNPKVVIDLDFANASELPDNGQALSKTVQVAFSFDHGDGGKVRLLTACEDQSVGVWELDPSLRILNSIQTVDLGAQVISTSWNLGGHSFTAVCGKKEEKLSDLRVFKVGSLEGGDGSSWKSSPLDIKTD